jgi:alanyl-tRNA synthetase
VTLKLYRDDPYLLEFEAEVVASFEQAGRTIVELDRTAFFAESGGQPCDLGRLAGIPVLAVEEHGAQVWHVLEHGLPATTTRVTGQIDAVRRRDHMQQHHGQHLFSRALLEHCGAQTVGFHLGAEETTIDLDRAPTREALLEALALANARVWDALPVEVREVEPAQAARLGCAHPNASSELVRLVAAGSFDLQACSGTHPRRTSEVGLILLLGSERHKGGSRLRFVCGMRALHAAGARFELLERLGTRFSATWRELEAATERSLATQADLHRRLETWTTRALHEEARRLFAEAGARGDTRPGPALVACVVAERTPAELRGLASALVALGPCVALLAAPDGLAGSTLVFARSPGLGADIAAALREALARLGGRGGGRGDVVQGGATRADGLDEVLATAAAMVQERAAS